MLIAGTLSKIVFSFLLRAIIDAPLELPRQRSKKRLTCCKSSDRCNTRLAWFATLFWLVASFYSVSAWAGEPVPKSYYPTISNSSRATSSAGNSVFDVGSLFDGRVHFAGADSSPDVIMPPALAADVAADHAQTQVTSPATTGTPTPGLIQNEFYEVGRNDGVGVNFYSQDADFTEGLVIRGRGYAMKVSGFVKVDLIHDFNAIDSTDTFNTTEIPIGALPRTNSRFHARQSRLNFDTRWQSDFGPVRIFIESDFFGDGDTMRLRHAYGEVRSLLVGQTWTTFTDQNTLPYTLDSEGAVSSVNRRQAQIRWSQPVLTEDFVFAVAIEDPSVMIDPDISLTGSSRTPSPDFIARLRYSPDWGQLQVATLFRKLAFQPTGRPVASRSAYGVNLAGALYLSEDDKLYGQFLVGEGIGSYRGLPDAAPSLTDANVLGMVGWMVGFTHNWSEQFSSNVTYSASKLDTISSQPGRSAQEDSYLAVNLIWTPFERSFFGVEYLHGRLGDVAGNEGRANRLQASFGFLLP